MSRSRNIKPGFFKNELLGEMLPIHRLLFIGLWTHADREGRFECRPRKIKAELFPYDDVNIEDGLTVLEDAGFLVIYSVDGRQYVQIQNWGKHQNPHHKEVGSTIPAPAGHTDKVCAGYIPLSNTIRRRIYARDGRKCRTCGTEHGLSIDHIIPVSKGGNSVDDNLQVLCLGCNLLKGNRIPATGDGKAMHASSMNHASSMENASCPTDSLIPDSLSLDSPSLIPDPLQEQGAPDGDASPVGEKPKGKRVKADKPPEVEMPEGVEPQTWADFLKLRKAKSAPVTQTVLREAIREADKAGMTLERFLTIWCARGSQGLQADWLKPHERAGPNGKPSAAANFRETTYTGTAYDDLPLNSADLLDEGVTETPGNCDLHGPYTAKTYSIAGRSITPYGCPVCNAEKSAAARAKREEEDRRQRQFERMRKVASLMGHAGIPRRFQDKTFDGYVPANRNAGIALTACRKYAETFPAQMEQGRSLVLAGGPGTGKTHLATSIGLHVINEFQAVVVFDPVSHALRRIKETYRPNAERTESQILAGYAECDLLILDEIGAQIGSEHEKQLMFEILNSRYQDMRPTILISNLNAKELEEFMGHRVMDRYRECGVVLAFDWPSHRGQKPVDAKTKAAGDE